MSSRRRVHCSLDVDSQAGCISRGSRKSTGRTEHVRSESRCFFTNTFRCPAMKVSSFVDIPMVRPVRLKVNKHVPRSGTERDKQFQVPLLR